MLVIKTIDCLTESIGIVMEKENNNFFFLFLMKGVKKILKQFRLLLLPFVIF